MDQAKRIRWMRPDTIGRTSILQLLALVLTILIAYQGLHDYRFKF